MFYFDVGIVSEENTVCVISVELIILLIIWSVILLFCTWPIYELWNLTAKKCRCVFYICQELRCSHSLALVLCVFWFLPRGLGRTRPMPHACLCSPREVPPVADHLADDAAILGCGGDSVFAGSLNVFSRYVLAFWDLAGRCGLPDLPVSLCSGSGP